MQQWALLAVSADGKSPLFMPHVGFEVAIYVCKTCGYIELFDLEPDQTIKNEAGK